MITTIIGLLTASYVDLHELCLSTDVVIKLVSKIILIDK